MAFPVTVYRWDDPGAPQIGNGRASDIINIWQKCLVDGYGTQLPLGWTRPFYDAGTQRAAFRNDTSNGGSGGYAVLYSNTLNDADYNLMRLTHAKSMSDIGTLIGQGVTKAFQVLNRAGDVRYSKWVLIGTSIGFYFVISQNNRAMGGSADYNPSMFVGDIFSSVPNDAGRFVTETGHANASDSGTVNFNQTLDYIPASNCGGAKIWGSDNSNVFETYLLQIAGFRHGSSAKYDSPPITQVLGPVYYGKSPLGSTIAPTEVASAVSPGFRGFLPGFFMGFIYYPADLAWPQIISNQGESFWLMRCTQGSPSAMVQLGEWHDPFL